MGGQTMQWPMLYGYDFCHSHRLSMKNIACSCLALPAFFTSRINWVLLLPVFTMEWHISVTIFWDNDKWIALVTREFCNRMTYFFFNQIQVHFQQWCWCYALIMCYIKMIFVKIRIVLFCTKSVCGKQRKTYDKLKILRIMCFVPNGLWHNSI